jgi:hypothetical protein
MSGDAGALTRTSTRRIDRAGYLMVLWAAVF